MERQKNALKNIWSYDLVYKKTFRLSSRALLGHSLTSSQGPI